MAIRKVGGDHVNHWISITNNHFWAYTWKQMSQVYSSCNQVHPRADQTRKVVKDVEIVWASVKHNNNSSNIQTES